MSIESVVELCLKVPGCLHVVLKCPFNLDMQGLQRLAATSASTSSTSATSAGGGGERSGKGGSGSQSGKKTPSSQVGPCKLSTWSLSKKVKCVVLSLTPPESAAHVPTSFSTGTKRKSPSGNWPSSDGSSSSAENTTEAPLKLTRPLPEDTSDVPHQKEQPEKKKTKKKKKKKQGTDSAR
jgi:hypothetical protein